MTSHDCDPIECADPAHGPIYPAGHPAMAAQPGGGVALFLLLPTPFDGHAIDWWSGVTRYAWTCECGESVIAEGSSVRCWETMSAHWYSRVPG